MIFYPSFGEVRAVVFFELNGDEGTALEFCILLNGHRPPAKSALQKMARGGEGGSARRENKPYITGAEAKVYATLKSDAIMVIVVHTDSHDD